TDLLSVVSRQYSGKRLCRPCLFPRDGARGHRTLLNGPQRFARYTVKYKQEALLGCLGYGIDAFIPLVHGNELWSGRQVIIPKIMMHGLEMPKPFARSCVQCQQAVAV